MTYSLWYLGPMSRAAGQCPQWERILPPSMEPWSAFSLWGCRHGLAAEIKREFGRPSSSIWTCRRHPLSWGASFTPPSWAPSSSPTPTLARAGSFAGAELPRASISRFTVSLRRVAHLPRRIRAGSSSRGQFRPAPPPIASQTCFSRRIARTRIHHGGNCSRCL